LKLTGNTAPNFHAFESANGTPNVLIQHNNNGLSEPGVGPEEEWDKNLALTAAPDAIPPFE
jgi:hypothetical protein